MMVFILITGSSDVALTERRYDVIILLKKIILPFSQKHKSFLEWLLLWEAELDLRSGPEISFILFSGLLILHQRQP